LHLIPQICFKIFDLGIEDANGVADVFVIALLRSGKAEYTQDHRYNDDRKRKRISNSFHCDAHSEPFYQAHTTPRIMKHFSCQWLFR